MTINSSSVNITAREISDEMGLPCLEPWWGKIYVSTPRIQKVQPLFERLKLVSTKLVTFYSTIHSSSVVVVVVVVVVAVDFDSDS